MQELEVWKTLSTIPTKVVVDASKINDRKVSMYKSLLDQSSDLIYSEIKAYKAVSD